MIARVSTRLVLPLVLALAAACGGDSPRREPLAPPPVSPALIVHGQGSLGLEIAGKGSHAIDPVELLRQSGAATECNRLVILLSWRTEGQRSLTFVSEMQRGPVSVGEGHAGVTSVPGCGVITVANNGDKLVKGELRYTVAETR